MAKSTPVTTRFDDQTLAAIERMIEAGWVMDRSQAINVLVKEGLLRHDPQAIAEGYRRAYAERPPTDEERQLVRSASERSLSRLVEAERDDR